jgi:hypothetical protein
MREKTGMVKSADVSNVRRPLVLDVRVPRGECGHHLHARQVRDDHGQDGHVTIGANVIPDGQGACHTHKIKIAITKTHTQNHKKLR